MEVTREELLRALRAQDPDVDLYESVDPVSGKIGGIVVTQAFQEHPDIARSQKMARYLREVFRERAAMIGILTVFSPTERQRRIASQAAS